MSTSLGPGRARVRATLACAAALALATPAVARAADPGPPAGTSAIAGLVPAAPPSSRFT